MKVAPVTVICVMLKVAVPVLEMIRDWDKVDPTTTFPKLMDVGLTRMAGAGAGFTVKVAALLVAVPALLLTTTSNVDPLSEVVVAGVV